MQRKYASGKYRTECPVEERRTKQQGCSRYGPKGVKVNEFRMKGLFQKEFSGVTQDVGISWP